MPSTVIREIQIILAASGWAESSGAAIATKGYKTAVGPKEALIYFSIDREYATRWLTGWYSSEGRNALGTVSATWDASAGLEDISAKVTAFSQAVDIAVSDTYACRLLRVPE